MMYDDENIMDYLNTAYPGAFENWDGYWSNIQVMNHVDYDPMILIELWSRGCSKQAPPVLTTAFLIHPLDEHVRVGGRELIEEVLGTFHPTLLHLSYESEDETEKEIV